MTAEIKLDLFRDIAKRRGWNSNVAIGKAIGMSPQQVKKILNGEQEPTMRFVAGFLTAVPEAGFRRVFNLVPAPDARKDQTA
jgi:hypothetical protein